MMKMQVMRLAALLTIGVAACLASGCRQASESGSREAATAPAVTQSSAPAPSAPLPPALPPPATESEARAREAVAQLRSRLQAALQTAMAQGPEHALTVCRDEAPRIAAAIRSETAADGGAIQVGRTSHRLRNPTNAPAPWLASMLPAYEAGTATAPSATVALPDGSLGYVEPIRTGALCVTCHGQQIAEPLQAKLTELYPQDQATGFAEGDFRGLFWAVVPQ